MCILILSFIIFTVILIILVILIIISISFVFGLQRTPKLSGPIQVLKDNKYENQIIGLHQNRLDHSLIPGQRFRKQYRYVRIEFTNFHFVINFIHVDCLHIPWIVPYNLKNSVETITSSSLFFSASSNAAFSACKRKIRHKKYPAINSSYVMKIKRVKTAYIFLLAPCFFSQLFSIFRIISN